MTIASYLRDLIQYMFYGSMVDYRGTKKKGSDYREPEALLTDGKHEAIVSKALFGSRATRRLRKLATLSGDDGIRTRDLCLDRAAC